VPVGLANFSFDHQKDARHSFHVTLGPAGPVAFQPSNQHAQDALVIDELAPAPTQQAEFLKQFPLGIRNTRQICKAVRRKKLLGFLLVTGEMNKANLRSFGFNLSSKLAELGDRLAAKGSTELPQEYQ